jgi:hypothetical protein
VSDRLLVAYGLMVLIVVGVGMAVWWNVHHSHRRTYKRRMAREREKAAAAGRIPSDPFAVGRDRT